MVWDDTKTTADDPDNPDSGEQVTASEWNDMVGDQKNHTTRHEDGGADEINVDGLSGVLAERQKPQQPTEPIGGIKIVERYDGAGKEDRLTNALSDATDGDTLILESGVVYNDDRTIGKSIAIRGVDLSTSQTTGTYLSGATWTFNAEATINGIGIFDNTLGIEISSQFCVIQDIVFFAGGDISVNSNDVILSKIRGNGTITFAGGTSGGEIGITTSGVTVTDNGNNSVL